MADYLLHNHSSIALQLCGALQQPLYPLFGNAVAHPAVGGHQPVRHQLLDVLGYGLWRDPQALCHLFLPQIGLMSGNLHQDLKT